MSEVVSAEDDDGGVQGFGLYPIRTVSRRTGVPSVTLRAWERRYGLITPTRTEKGHRLYTEADIERVRQVLALMERGVGVGQVGPFLARAANDGDLVRSANVGDLVRPTNEGDLVRVANDGELGRLEASAAASSPVSLAPPAYPPAFPVPTQALTQTQTPTTTETPAQTRTPTPAQTPTQIHDLALSPSLAGIEIQAGQAGGEARIPVMFPGTDPWPAYIAAMLEGVRRFDTAALDAVYNDALSLYPIERVSSHLTTPVLERLGAAWPQGEASIAREHFFSNFLRNKLGARFQHLNALGQGRRLVAACPAGEHHELGLIQFALAAAGQGYRLVLLGADVPATEIAAAARIAECRAVVLSASAQMPDADLARELAALVALTPLPILVGGMASVRAPRIITDAGARPLGTDFTSALRLIGDCLGWPQAAD